METLAVQLLALMIRSIPDRCVKLDKAMQAGEYVSRGHQDNLTMGWIEAYRAVKDAAGALKRLGDVAAARGFPDLDSFEAHNAVFDFFVENDGLITIISHHGDEPTVQRLFKRPTMAICTDGLMPGPGQKPHPRSIGAFPKALRYARELGVPLKEIVYRMTAMPAAFFHIESPVLRPGADASLVLFDWERVRELNDYEDPTIPPEGIERVWVHGTLVLESGTFHIPDPYPGRILQTVPVA